MCGLLVAPPPAAAELPPPIQAALLEKVFLFDAALRDDRDLLVVFAEPADEAAAQRLVAAFRAAGLTAEVVAATDAASRVPGAAVVYFLGGRPADSLRALCVEHERLSVAGDAALAEAGQVAVAVDVAPSGNPEIVVHRDRLEEEGHRLEPRLLKLARLVG